MGSTEKKSISEGALAERRISELEEKLRLREGELLEARKELESFSYTISHDLRAPVRHITGYIELLDQEELSLLDEKSRHYIEVVYRSATTLARMVDDVLAFSRIGRVELTKTTVELGGLVQEAVAELGEELQGREVFWEVGPLPTVMGDRALLRQVMVNLIGNSLKFTRDRVPARIEIGSAAGSPGEVQVFVRDNGMGFDMKYQEKLFVLFQRLHSREELEGSGAGLAKVKRIVSRHGGRVWAEGETDRGATFWFSLPVAEEVK